MRHVPPFVQRASTQTHAGPGTVMAPPFGLHTNLSFNIKTIKHKLRYFLISKVNQIIVSICQFFRVNCAQNLDLQEEQRQYKAIQTIYVAFPLYIIT